MKKQSAGFVVLLVIAGAAYFTKSLWMGLVHIDSTDAITVEIITPSYGSGSSSFGFKDIMRTNQNYGYFHIYVSGDVKTLPYSLSVCSISGSDCGIVQTGTIHFTTFSNNYRLEFNYSEILSRSQLSGTADAMVITIDIHDQGDYVFSPDSKDFASIRISQLPLVNKVDITDASSDEEIIRFVENTIDSNQGSVDPYKIAYDILNPIISKKDKDQSIAFVRSIIDYYGGYQAMNDYDSIRSAMGDILSNNLIRMAGSQEKATWNELQFSCDGCVLSGMLTLQDVFMSYFGGFSLEVADISMYGLVNLLVPVEKVDEIVSNFGGMGYDVLTKKDYDAVYDSNCAGYISRYCKTINLKGDKKIIFGLKKDTLNAAVFPIIVGSIQILQEDRIITLFWNSIPIGYIGEEIQKYSDTYESNLRDNPDIQRHKKIVDKITADMDSSSGHYAKAFQTIENIANSIILN